LIVCVLANNFVVLAGEATILYESGAYFHYYNRLYGESTQLNVQTIQKIFAFGFILANLLHGDFEMSFLFLKR
jgi:hypothetical protein